jgi:hypothetical protein
MQHQREAINRLIRGDFIVLDPSIGDMSCQLHALSLLNMYWTVQKYLNKEEKLQHALTIVEKYNDAHRNDKNDKEIRTVADLDNPYQPPEYDVLFAELNEILGNNDIELLGPFYSLTSPIPSAEMNSGRSSFVFAVKSLALPQAEIQSIQNPSWIVCRCFAVNWRSTVSITLTIWSKHCPVTPTAPSPARC